MVCDIVFSFVIDDDMTRMVQCGYAPIAFLEVIGIIVGNDVAHSKWRAYFFFNEKNHSPVRLSMNCWPGLS
jgi:hypothetical protein